MNIMLPILIACTISAILGGVVGTFVVVKRIAFVSGSIAHAILAGIGLCVWLHAAHIPAPDPLWGALGAAIISSIAIAYAENTFAAREDSLIATVWAAGMALGIIFITKTPGYTADISSLFIGNILWVTYEDIYIVSALTVVCLTFIAWKFEELKLLIFDKDYALLQGVPVKNLSTQLLVVVAITVVLLTQIVGIVLVMTMLTLPQLLANLMCQKLSSLVIVSAALSIGCSLLGIVCAQQCDWPIGASIALTSTLAYLFGLVIAHLYRITKAQQISS